MQNENIKTLWVINNVKEEIDYAKFKVKIFRGKPNTFNKKELLTICKEKINEILTKEYYKIFDLFKLFDKLNYDLNEILIIDDNKGNSIASFIKGKNYKKINLEKFREKEI